MKKYVDIGMIVYDRSYGMTGVVVEQNPVLNNIDLGGAPSTWDWGILYEDGQIGYADNAEIEVVNEWVSKGD